MYSLKTICGTWRDPIIDGTYWATPQDNQSILKRFIRQDKLGWVLMTHEKVLTPHEKVLIPHEKSINVAIINFNSQKASKIIFWILCWVTVVLRVQSRKNNPVNITRFKGGFKT